MEYVILLVAIVALGVAGWKLFGRSTYAHADHASGAMSSLDEPAAHGGGGRAAHRTVTAGSHLEDATGDATPPAAAGEGWFGPGMLAAAALLLVGAMAARQLQQGSGAKKS